MGSRSGGHFRKSALAVLVTAVLAALSASPVHAAPTRYEAETSPAACAGTIDTNWSGYTGSGFCNGDNAIGAYAQFTVNASSARTAAVGIRFANGGRTARPVNLVVNDSTVASPSFESTGAWSTWLTK